MIKSLDIFDIKFSKILKTKISPEIGRIRIFLEEISDTKLKVLFFQKFVARFAEHESFFVKLLFWESPEEFIEKVLLSKFDASKIKIIRQKSDDFSDPCVVWFHGDKLDSVLLYEIILWHFNFELAESPSANMRVQFSLTESGNQILWDVYDDRGCDVYWLKEN